MLRRTLLIRIGLLVACFVCGAVGAIVLLQNAITDVERINQEAAQLSEGAQTVTDALAACDIPMPSLGPDPYAVDQSSLRKAVESAVQSLSRHEAMHGETSLGAAFSRVQEIAAAIVMSTPVSAETAQGHAEASRELARAVRTHVAEEQQTFGRRFRVLVLSLTLAALVMVNVAVFVLLHTAQVVLKPVNELVQGSRELAAEHFDHRLRIEQQDEFGELARSYNLLAEQLQANEERKAEALRQLAVTLNHDLNNAMTTIEMQLRLLDRQSGSSTNLAKYFQDIQLTLARMSRTVASLKNIRRVVLTEYLDGQKMVDLERSVLPAPRTGEVA